MKVTNLINLGNSLPVDKDFELKKLTDGSLILINLKEQEYPYEIHPEVEELIIAIQGDFFIETQDELVSVPEGHMVTIPRGIKHRFSSKSNSIILVGFGK